MVSSYVAAAYFIVSLQRMKPLFFGPLQSSTYTCRNEVCLQGNTPNKNFPAYFHYGAFPVVLALDEMFFWTVFCKKTSKPHQQTEGNWKQAGMLWDSTDWLGRRKPIRVISNGSQQNQIEQGFDKRIASQYSTLVLRNNTKTVSVKDYPQETRIGIRQELAKRQFADSIRAKCQFGSGVDGSFRMRSETEISWGFCFGITGP